MAYRIVNQAQTSRAVHNGAGGGGGSGGGGGTTPSEIHENVTESRGTFFCLFLHREQSVS